MKFGQFFKNYAENEAGEPVPVCFLFFFKNFILAKSKWSVAWFYSISIVLKLVYNRNKLLKTLHYWPRDMLKFDILGKGLGIFSAAHFVYDISTKMFLKLYSINWPNFIV